MQHYIGGMRKTFSDAEKAAMRQRAAELRAEKGLRGAAKREREYAACLEAIEQLSGVDQELATCLHRVVHQEAPNLDAKTWYGFPSYAKEGKVLVFMQPASKFETRYATVGFNDIAELDEGSMWATSFAVTSVTPHVEQKLRELVRKANGADAPGN